MAGHDNDSYKDMVSSFTLFQKLLATILALAAFAGGCVTLGIQIGKVNNMQSTVATLTIEVNKQNKLLAEFMQEGTRWTYEHARSNWEQSKSNYYQNPEGFWMAEPKVNHTRTK